MIVQREAVGLAEVSQDDAQHSDFRAVQVLFGSLVIECSEHIALALKQLFVTKSTPRSFGSISGHLLRAWYPDPSQGSWMPYDGQ
ncbi:MULTISPECIES: hypothetical protein [unclassified Rhizobium]|uniref:hypothetical protein n=1 Tax=unclassified Rhizobium TaxID=2613769 RepID=UPI001607577C|nr:MULTISPECIES: hypothetical protein [unclassified Rhizobium]MBB3539315.1 hypothetical protein [Rhizobium sp. BK399]MCS3744371.1 hypothetical protein [Rhizobium sp. BK661]MCS4093459.1 hypothetical protein [Rhizobium sp. BK176]